MDEEMQMPVEERVTSTWEPLKFETGNDYDYLRNAWYKRLGTALFRRLVAFILCFYNGLVLGVKVHGRENLRALKGTGAVAVCNHVHNMDCTINNIALLPRRVYHVSLDSNFRIPVVRHIIRWLGAVPLSRSPKQVRRLFSEMKRHCGPGPSSRCTRRGSWCPTPGRCGSSTMADSGWRRRPTCRCCP